MESKEVYQFYSTVKCEEVSWLWYPYIPYGRITLLQGDPGDGKSTCMIKLAATLSSGGVLPDGTQIPEPQTVIYQCAEDNINDTVKPRLEQAGADCENIAFIREENLSINDRRIEETIQKINAKLLILDPIQAFLSQDADMQSSSKVRTIMNELSCLAEKYECAVVLIGHLSKSSSTKTLYRGLGSINIAAVARSVLMISRNKYWPEVRYLSQIKNSLAPEGCSFAFIMDPVYGFQWLGKSHAENDEGDHISYGTALEKKPKLEKAEELIKILLSEEDLPSKQVIDRLKRLSISERTVRTAAKELHIEAYRKKKIWLWRLPDSLNSDNT